MNGLSILVAVLAVTFLTVEAIIPNEYNDIYKYPPSYYDSKAFYGQLPLSSSLVPFSPYSSFPTSLTPVSPTPGNTPPQSYPQMPYATWPFFSIESNSSDSYPSPYPVPYALPPAPYSAPILPLPPSCQSSSLPQPSIPQPSIPQPSISRPSIPKPSIPQPSIPQPSIPRPSIPQPSIPQPSIPQPSIPQPSLLQPSSPSPSFIRSPISPAVMDLLLKYISMITPQSGSPPVNAHHPYLTSLNVSPTFPKLIPISFKPIQLPRPPTLYKAVSSSGQLHPRSGLSSLNAKPPFSFLNHSELPSPYRNY